MSAYLYNLVIAGGTVIDPAHAMDEAANVALKDDRFESAITDENKQREIIGWVQTSAITG